MIFYLKLLISASYRHHLSYRLIMNILLEELFSFHRNQSIKPFSKFSKVIECRLASAYLIDDRG